MATMRRVALMAVLAMAVAACGDGEAPTQADRDAGTGTASAEEFCAAKVALDAISPDTPDEEALRRVQGELRPALERLERAADAELSEHVATMADAYLSHDTLADTTAAVGTEAFGSATSAIAEYTHESCGFSEAAFEAVDDRYASAPETIPAGQTFLFLHNGGEHQHAVVVFRLKDGVTASAAELAADGSFEREGEFVTSLFGPAGANAGVVTELRPGRYFYFDDEHMGTMSGIFEVA